MKTAAVCMRHESVERMTKESSEDATHALIRNGQHLVRSLGLWVLHQADITDSIIVLACAWLGVFFNQFLFCSINCVKMAQRLKFIAFSKCMLKKGDLGG